MARSIMQEDKRCYICEQQNNLERHHIFGAFNRNNSEKIRIDRMAVPRLPQRAAFGCSSQRKGQTLAAGQSTAKI
nr:MAG TPA: hypothetical protein [Caudoviricetes sp.]